MKTEAQLTKYYEDILSKLNYPNVALDYCTVHDEDDVELFIVINFGQDKVEPGLPKQTLIYSDRKEITVSYLASTYDPDSGAIQDIQDIEVKPYSISQLKRFIIDYQSQTY